MVDGEMNLSQVADRLAAAGCIAAGEEAAQLLGAAPDRLTLDRWVTRREQGEPLAWITGATRFCGRSLHVEPGVYVPRAQTEELARRAAARLDDMGLAVDLCTGAGAVAAHLQAQVPSAFVVGIDADLRAAQCARRNGVPSIVADLAEPLVATERTRVGLVTAVAPYVPTEGLRLLPVDVQRYEPRHALDGGIDGLDVVRRVIAAAARLLTIGGWLMLEVGGDQDQQVAPDLEASGFGLVEPWWDDDGDLRGLASQAIGGER